MGDITHFLDDVTRFSPIQKNGPDRYMELGPNCSPSRGVRSLRVLHVAGDR
jgi:hypothetical protein